MQKSSSDHMAGIKEAIQSGVDPETIYKDFMNEYNTAVKEVKDEEKAKKAKTIDEARKAYVDAALAYLNAIGWIDDDDISDEMYEECLDVVKDAEGACSVKRGHTDDFDWIIRDFIKNW